MSDNSYIRTRKGLLDQLRKAYQYLYHIDASRAPWRVARSRDSPQYHTVRPDIVKDALDLELIEPHHRWPGRYTLTLRGKNCDTPPQRWGERQAKKNPPPPCAKHKKRGTYCACGMVIYPCCDKHLECYDCREGDAKARKAYRKPSREGGIYRAYFQRGHGR